MDASPAESPIQGTRVRRSARWPELIPKRYKKMRYVSERALRGFWSRFWTVERVTSVGRSSTEYACRCRTTNRISLSHLTVEACLLLRVAADC